MEAGPPFAHHVSQLCQNVLLAVRALAGAHQASDEAGGVEGSQQTASAIIRLTAIVEERAEQMPDDVATQQLLATTIEAREQVVAFIRHTRESFANPFDYMTRQEAETARKKVHI